MKQEYIVRKGKIFRIKNTDERTTRPNKTVMGTDMTKQERPALNPRIGTRTIKRRYCRTWRGGTL